MLFNARVQRMHAKHQSAMLAGIFVNCCKFAERFCSASVTICHLQMSIKKRRRFGYSHRVDKRQREGNGSKVKPREGTIFDTYMVHFLNFLTKLQRLVFAISQFM